MEIPITNQRERQTYYGAIDASTGDGVVIPFEAANGYWTFILSNICGSTTRISA